MAKERRCKYCGGTGHDSRNCPAKMSKSKDHALWIKVSNIDEDQADKLLFGFIKLKKKYAPDGQAAFAKGDKKSLPERIRKSLGMKED